MERHWRRNMDDNFNEESDESDEEMFVDCPYKIAGCKEKLESGSDDEREHIETCNFRPVPCLMQDFCTELVPYQNYLLHQMQHFLQPQFSTSLATSMVFAQEDFTRSRRWTPRWINAYGRDFFLIVAHRIPDMWYFWVCMLGSQDEANQYYYDIEVCKGEDKKRGTYSVLSIRTTIQTIESQECAMSMTGIQIKKISKIQKNLYGNFQIDMVIHKLKTAPTGLLVKDPED